MVCFKILFYSSSVVCLSVCEAWGQGTTSNPKGCSIPMWWRQSGQVNTALFCPLYFLLVHINRSPRGGATCSKSTVHFYFLNVLPTPTPNVLDIIFRFLLVSRETTLTSQVFFWHQININKSVRVCIILPFFLTANPPPTNPLPNHF